MLLIVTLVGVPTFGVVGLGDDKKAEKKYVLTYLKYEVFFTETKNGTTPSIPVYVSCEFVNSTDL